MDPASWAEASGVSEPGALGSGVLLIVSLSEMFLYSLSKIAECIFLALMIGNGSQGQWQSPRQRQSRGRGGAEAEAAAAVAAVVGVSAAAKTADSWGGFIVKVDRLFSSVICSVVNHIAAFVFECSHFLFPLTYLSFSES